MSGSIVRTASGWAGVLALLALTAGPARAALVEWDLLLVQPVPSEVLVTPTGAAGSLFEIQGRIVNTDASQTLVIPTDPPTTPESIEDALANISAPAFPASLFEVTNGGRIVSGQFGGAQIVLAPGEASEVFNFGSIRVRDGVTLTLGDEFIVDAALVALLKPGGGILDSRSIAFPMTLRVVPVPASLPLLVAGVVGLLLLRRGAPRGG